MVKSSFDQKSECLTIYVKGRFDYSCHKDFKQAFIESEKARIYKVDLSEVDYLDSSALGMLLLLRDHAGGETAEVHLMNVKMLVVDILKMANFHRLFNVIE